MAVYTTHSPGETIALGRRLAETLRGGEVILFTGGMGMGKTTLCRGIAQGLGCADEAQSPTFSIVNYYRGPVPFAHFDAYRVAGADDLETAGFYDYIEEGAVVAVEWSENIAHLAPEGAIRIAIEGEGETRRFSIEGAAGI